jgi:hypothetical protein
MRYLHDRLDLISNKFWDRHPSIYVACATWGVGSIFIHQFVLSTVLITAIVLLARHEGWRKGRQHP